MTELPVPPQPDQQPSRARRRSRADRWRHDAVELAAVFLAVATADLVADVVVHGHDGPVLLVSSAFALIATAVFHSWWQHRHPHGPPGPEPTAPPGGSALPPAETVLWRLRATVSDAPGSLATVCAALAELRVSIISLQTHPLPEATVDEFLLRAPRELSRSVLAGAVARAGGREIWTDPADAHDLVDLPTHVLALATRTALDAAELPVALRRLFGQCAIRQFPSLPADQDAPSLAGHLMRLPLPSGGLVELSRPHLPFTPTEFARAKALVELDAVLGPRVPQVAARLSLPAGADLTVRRADPADKAEALAMHRRCSSGTLRRRYHGPVADADRYLEHLLDPRHGQTLAVQSADGRIVALAHLMWDDDSAELAVLVEDDWQRRGLGHDLLRRMAALAAEAGVATVYAVTQAANTALIGAMRKLQLPLDYQVEDGTLVITAHLAGATEQLPTPWPAVPGR
ncbi:RimJ/RimL family protein N-acetyltransferase [Kitasatospora sp. MAP12-15]|uniref:GNAT family N-acetyltransferase n=1 Tax=unclassified Kitasatospora TaxID=2633591 RepID=UPI0024763B70|nr:GNAT family N-acetyltransferase [Kitasatospora sp. MAP12-44]MDH6114830.1 RimJ/RimL family protein N-acetyltransferase [Kitasatospora sp. MAP12-44]